MTMYELVDPTAEAVLAADAARGVRVRVLLDSGLERRRNAPAFDYLSGAGVQVRWSARRFFATHEKTFVIDGRAAVVMSCNLASSYYATTRDIAVVDPDPRDAAAIERVFDADFAGRATATPTGDDLVWSPTGSRPDLLAIIAAARERLLVESEELSDPLVVGALLAAVHRGVHVELAMTYQEQWAPALRDLAAAGATVATMQGERPLYLHAKLMVADPGTAGQRAFVGSENLAVSSLLRDRELGLVLLRPALVAQVTAVIEHDVAAGTPWPGG